MIIPVKPPYDVVLPWFTAESGTGVSSGLDSGVGYGVGTGLSTMDLSRSLEIFSASLFLSP